MKARVLHDRTEVTLSKRNLLALLAKVDDPSSARTIWCEYESMDTWKPLYMTVETDEEHYADRPGPGRMHPKAEAFIAEKSGHCLKPSHDGGLCRLPSGHKGGCSESPDTDEEADVRRWLPE